MSKRKKKHKKQARYKERQSFYESLWLPAKSEDIKAIALQVFGSVYYTVDQLD